MHRRPQIKRKRPLVVLTSALTTALLLAGAPQGAEAFVTPAGYINFDQSQAKKFQLNAGIGGMFPGYGSLFVSGDIFITPKLSIPVGIQGFFAAGGGGFTVYAGIRYRVISILSIGGGVGGALFAFDWTGFGDGGTAVTGDFRVAAELALGKRLHKHFGISFNFKPTFGTVWGAVFLPVELDFAVFVTERWAITIIVTGGPMFGYTGGVFGYGGGYLGVAGTF